MLAVVEVELSVVLLVCAGLFLRAFVRLQAVSPGFPPEHLLVVRLSLPVSKDKSPTAIRNFYDGLHGRVAALPGVESAAMVSYLPLSGANNRSEFLIGGRQPATPQDMPAAQNRWVSAGYFHAMGIPLKEGREFTDRDVETARGAAVVDQALARKYWPNESPLGQHIRMDERDFEIVGVAGNVKHNSLNEDPAATLYAPIPQATPTALPFLAGNLSLVMRTAQDPASLADAVRRELRTVDATVPASSVKTMEQFIALTVGPRRFNLRLIAIFAVVALVLAAMGMYAVISFSVSRRVGEIGIRMALGASPGDVLRLIVGQGLRLMLIGIAAGIGAAAAARLLSGLLFETSANDPVTFVSVPVLFAIVGVAASYLPARRALRVDPLIAMRAE
ncbi:conserved membrane hypothetical protein [Candidatus Sulfopaludibacter sp. SbA3]|nr:conserved membrane hypothetical protein [Candidatus Sulfopaludibacter sp. SbA3]